MKEAGSESKITSNYREVQETTRLSPEREFYHQYPFQDIFKAASEPYSRILKLDSKDVQSDLAYVVSTVLSSFKTPSDKPLVDRELVLGELLGQRSRLSRKLPNKRREKYPVLEKDIVTTSVKKIFVALDVYPHWQDYVITQRDTGLYSIDGKISPSYAHSKIRPEHFPPTYLEWVTTHNRLSRQINQQLQVEAVLGEFPQQATRADATGSAGRAEARRKWRIGNLRGINRSS